MISPTTSQQQHVPKWVGVLIATVIIGAFIVGVALWVFSPAPPKDVVEVTGQGAGAQEINRALVLAARSGRQANAGVIRRGNSYIVRGGTAELTATRQNDAWNLQFAYLNKPDLMTPDMQAAMLARNRLAIDAFYAKSLNVTEEQVKQLRTIPSITNLSSAPVAVTSADTDRMGKLMDAYVAATNNSANIQALQKAVQEIADARLEASRSPLQERSKKIASILTAEQIAAFKVK